MGRIAVLSRGCFVALVAVSLGASLPLQPASAQVTRADSAAVLLETAAAFQDRGDADVAEAIYRHIVDRFPGTNAAETARAWLDSNTTGRAQAGGETELKVWSTTYGIWLGLTVPSALSADGPEPYGVGLVLGAPGGFFAGRAFAQSRPLTLGQARAITWGGTWGAWHGMALAHALDLGGESWVYDGQRYEEQSTESVLTSMIVGSAVGLASGALAARSEITPGTATSATLGTLWGAWIGLASSILLDLNEDPTWAATMIAGDVGLLAGALAGSRWPLTRSRARLISIGGLIGGVGGVGALLITDSDFGDNAIAVPLAGSIVGLAMGAALTGGHDAEEDMSGDADAAGAPAPPGALLNWSRGSWSLSAPLPSPVLDPVPGNGPRDGLAWKVPLLNVRF